MRDERYYRGEKAENECEEECPGPNEDRSERDVILAGENIRGTQVDRIDLKGLHTLISDPNHNNEEDQ